MVAEAFARVFKRFPDVALFHIVFDSYMDNSLEGGERATRIAAAGGIIRLARIRSDTKVPEQMPKFWAYSANKEKFQSFVTSHVLDLARKIKISIIFSGTAGGIRYQVLDFTLVGGSFFLPKTQLVHGTNWWVYCPFSRKTVSTWY